MINPEDLRVCVTMEGDDAVSITRSALRGVGVRQIVHEANGAAVARIIKEQDPDILITMVRDTEKDPGLTLTRLLRQSKASPNRYIPILVLSPLRTVSAVRATINAGAHEFLPFPISGDLLWKKMSRAIFMGAPFVETKDYFGPCRRRYVDPSFKGQERRADWTAAAGASRQNQEERLEQILSREDQIASAKAGRAAS